MSLCHFFQTPWSTCFWNKNKWVD